MVLVLCSCVLAGISLYSGLRPSLIRAGIV